MPNEDILMPQDGAQTGDILTNTELQNDSPVVENNQPAVETTTAEPMIVLQDVDIYQKKILVLSKVSFTINKGEYVYLVGKTGTGKSSIIKLLMAEIPPKNGEAMCVGYNLKTIKTKKIPYLRREFGVVFQDYQLLSDKTVAENLIAAMKATGWKDKSQMENRVKEVLSLVHLETKDFKYPHQLSGGEQQRVCIARALINRPSLILADEPTGNLDPVSAEEIFQLLHDINEKQGTTVLMSTHNFTMLDKFPSRTICIEEGKLIDTML